MEKQTKEKAKIGVAVGAGAGLLGFVQGAGVDHILADKIVDSMKAGDIKSALAFIAIFLLIWLQVKGVRNELKEVRLALTSPDAPIAISFAKGEARMNAIEEKHAHDQRVTEQHLIDHEHRLTVLEQQQNPQGGMHNGKNDLLS